jgi:hypothetical protein
MSSTLLLLNISLVVASLTALLAPRLSFTIRLYLTAELIGGALEGVSLQYHWWGSIDYLAVWIPVVVFVRSAGFMLVWYYGSRWPQLVLGVVAALGLGWWTYLGVDSPIPLESWCILLEASLCVAFGIMLIFRAPLIPDQVMPLMSIAVMWLVMAAFDYGLLLHPGWPYWDRIADMGSYWIVIAAFAWITVWQRGWLKKRRGQVSSSQPRLQTNPSP